MVGMVILGETEAQRGETTCVDSSSSQVTKLGWKLKSADPQRHVKKIRGLFAGEGVRGVMGGKIYRREFVYNLGCKVWKSGTV